MCQLPQQYGKLFGTLYPCCCSGRIGLMHMRTVISYVSRYEDHFRAVMEQKLRLSSEAAIRGHKKRLAQAEKAAGRA